MSDNKASTDKIDILRMSNEESNKITKESIETALIELLKTQYFEKISISDIVKRAGVSRMTYYRNYSSKEDILSSLISEFWNAIVKAFTPLPDLTEVEAATKFLDTIKQYKDTYKVIIKADKQDHILQSLNNFVLNVIPDKSVKGKYMAYLASGMLYNVVTEWLKNDIEISSKELAEIALEFRKSCK